MLWRVGTHDVVVAKSETRLRRQADAVTAFAARGLHCKESRLRVGRVAEEVARDVEDGKARSGHRLEAAGELIVPEHELRTEWTRGWQQRAKEREARAEEGEARAGEAGEECRLGSVKRRCRQKVSRRGEGSGDAYLCQIAQLAQAEVEDTGEVVAREVDPCNDAARTVHRRASHATARAAERLDSRTCARSPVEARDDARCALL
eukprot:6552350-Prymnesium_polylepis.1